MAFRLLPREEKFYTDFQALGDELMRGARLLEEMLTPDKPTWDKADEIKEVEHKCDFLTHEIIQRLNRTFVTPLDREDIFALARSLDDVMDAIDASATLVRLYRLDRVRFGAGLGLAVVLGVLLPVRAGVRWAHVCHRQPPIGARGLAPQKICVPTIPMTCTSTRLSTIDFAVALPTPTGPPPAL